MSDPTEPSDVDPVDDASEQVSEVVEPDRPAHAETGATLELSPLEEAIADAVALLSGPALTIPDDAPSADELEALWGEEATTALERVRGELAGKRVGLAISGGGSLGSFEAGALRFVYDHLGVRPVAITGNSAGALNAVALAHGDDDEHEPAIDKVERLWRDMRVNEHMWEPEPWLERILASASWASALRQSNGEGNAAGAVRVAVRVVNSLVRRPEETDGTVDAIKDALKAQSLLSLQPVANLIARELDLERVAESGIALRIGAVSLESGELRYITEKGEMLDRAGNPLDHPRVPLADALVASASIPVAFPPVRIGEEHYVDGGAREILPLAILLDTLDVDVAIAISASSPAITPSYSYAERGLFDIMRRVTAEIATNETLRKELDPPRGWGEKVRLVIPEIDVHDTMTIDPALISISFDHGWMRAADQLLGLPEDLCHLTTLLTKTRIQLRDLAGPLPSLFGTNPDKSQRDDLADAAGARSEQDRSKHGWTDGEATLTARLREQVTARREAGGPIPKALAAWLAAPVLPLPPVLPPNTASEPSIEAEPESERESVVDDYDPATSTKAKARLKSLVKGDSSKEKKPAVVDDDR
ncbi:MAG: patatin-like phospholipase family protein [Aquihabitans sp.]